MVKNLLAVVLVFLSAAAFAQQPSDSLLLKEYGVRFFDTDFCKCPPNGYRPAMTQESPYRFAEVNPIVLDSLPEKLLNMLPDSLQRKKKFEPVL